MNEIKFNSIPRILRERRQWVLWETLERNGKPTKVPVQPSGHEAKSNDPATWTDFATVQTAAGELAGIGFVFSPDDAFCGIDLDGCRDPETGGVSEWAREIILKFDSYAEVSPSKTGIKIWCVGESPFGSGKNLKLKDAPSVCAKEPGIEVYDQGRYFAMTGWRVRGPGEPQERQEALDWLKAKYWPDEPAPAQRVDFHDDRAVFDRARKYLAKLPGAVSGQNGHNATFHAACVLVLGFELPEAEALELMREFNLRCNPAWSERDLVRKVKEAAKQNGKKGYLRNSAPANWQRIPVPTYTAALPEPNEQRVTTLVDAQRSYIASLRENGNSLIGTSLSELDYALSGGVAPGEMVIFAARPSHGKSAFALQCVHFWTEFGLPCAIVSEEMSALMLGKRSLHFTSAIPEEHWPDVTAQLEQDVDRYAKIHKTCVVLESCGTTAAAIEGIERAIDEQDIKCAVVDYAQLLRAPGKNRYEQVTNTSIALRQLATRRKIVLVVLCQLNRAIEGRGSFMPMMSDLRESGQLEQDCDVLAMLCWPHRLDQSEPEGKYQFFIKKNRNRELRQDTVTCRFVSDRQMMVEPKAGEFDDAPASYQQRQRHRRDTDI